MALYDPVNGVYRKVAKKYDPVSGVYRTVKAAYDSVDGVYRQYFSSDLTAGGLAVGDSVWLGPNKNAYHEFLVVHQGNPDPAIYDASCDGTWLMRKFATSNRVFDFSNNDYKNSNIHAYLNGQYLSSLFGSNAQSSIKEVKIPYVDGPGDTGSVLSGSSGLSAKIFSLSGYEVGSTTSDNANLPIDGAKLDYFALGTGTTAKTLRIGYYSNNPVTYFLRSPEKGRNDKQFSVVWDGSVGSVWYSDACGMRPALVLDSAAKITENNGKYIIEEE